MVGHRVRVEPSGGAEAGEQQRQRQHVRQQHGASVDPGRGQQRPSEQAREPDAGGGNGEDGPGGDGEGGQLYGRRQPTDDGTAVAATAPQQRVAEQRDQVERCQRVAALVALRAGEGDGAVFGQALDQNAGETADERRRQQGRQPGEAALGEFGQRIHARR